MADMTLEQRREWAKNELINDYCARYRQAGEDKSLAHAIEMQMDGHIRASAYLADLELDDLVKIARANGGLARSR